MFLPTLCLQQERKKDKEKIKKRKENDLPGAVMQINKWVPVTKLLLKVIVGLVECLEISYTCVPVSQ